MFPQLIHIGDFFIPTYGVLVTTAFLAALWLAAKLASSAGLDKEAVLNLGIYCGLAALAGAKLLMFVYDFDYYRRNPGEILSMSTLQAGGVFQGGLIAALLVAFFYMRKMKLPGLATADAFAPAIALGHAIGRLGCFAAGCCWGLECHRSWAVTFTNPVTHKLFGTPLNVPLHPAQLYEAGAEALIFAVLYRRFRSAHKPGAIIGLYLVLYSIARFVIDFYRAQDQPNPFGGPFTDAQWIALASLALGSYLLVKKARLPVR